MEKLNETSLKMRDGSGSLAVLGVYHELHCVVRPPYFHTSEVFGDMPWVANNLLLFQKRLRKWFYREYYYPNQTELEFNERMTHAGKSRVPDYPNAFVFISFLIFFLNYSLSFFLPFFYLSFSLFIKR